MALAKDLPEAIQRLAGAGVPSPEADAYLLLAHLLACSLGEAKVAVVLDKATPTQWWDLIEQRCARVPVQHLTGTTDFCGIPLHVGPGVFTPRPETEAIIAWVTERLDLLPSAPIVVDLCTGSGALAVAVKELIPTAQVHAVERDPMAAAWAMRNTEPRGIHLHQGDATRWTHQVAGHCDLVLSNPPYIPPEAIPKDPEVRDHDPEMALYGLGADGLQVPRGITENAARLLTSGGLFAMEHAEVQQKQLLDYVLATGQWHSISGHQDLTQRPRFVSAIRR